MVSPLGQLISGVNIAYAA